MAELDRLVDALEVATGQDEAPCWFEISMEADPSAISLRRHDDLAGLVGWSAASCFDAIGVVAGGWAHCDGGEARRAVRIVVVLDRCGRVGSRAGFADGAPSSATCRGGRLFDTLQRCLGLATDPAPSSSAGLIGDLWLGALVAMPRRTAALNWAEVAAAHPANQGLAGCGARLSLSELEAVIRICPRLWTWERLRAETIAGAALAGLVAPEIASWMDVGMFARWALASHGDPRQLWGRAVAGLDAEVVVRLANALDEADDVASSRSGGGPARRGTFPAR